MYLLLCILSVFFSRNFLGGLLWDGSVPGALSVVVFFTVPAALLVFLGVSAVNLIRESISRKAGSKFQTRLFVYFIVTVIFAAVPVTVITTQSLYEFLRFWRTVRIEEALTDAQDFIMDSYSSRLEQFKKKIESANFDAVMRLASVQAEGGKDSLALAEEEMAALGIIGVQDFQPGGDGVWLSGAFVGNRRMELDAPPGTIEGFISRQMPRDIDTVRYIIRSRTGLIRVISCDIGAGFDASVENIKSEKVKFEILDSISINLISLLGFFYGVFFLPAVLLTMIIAISFTRRVSQPLVELTEATRQVAEGDFSIQIMVRPKDELGVLIRSFNAMVRDLEKSRESRLQAEKVSIWQSLAQQLAHEIKNPLTPIKLSADRVLRRWRTDPDRLGEILETSMLSIIQEVEGLSGLLTEFRTLSRPIEPAKTWIPLKEAVEEAIIPYRSSHPGVEFDTRYIQDDISVRMDQRHISQVITNLLINGIDAMDGEGRIEIRTDLVKKRRGRRYCRLSVRDSGKGISRQDYGKVFVPYFTTKESGTGLGLTIVERIIHEHDGAIWFNSKEGAGTTFFIDFPLDSAIPVSKPDAEDGTKQS
ncbi:MAG: HAMP domain-containing protein [Treponema sp.]|jgi:nitrogen fixation/metabolism regulation signal transduction histidine kinase|nr:HAMP domain-containing protein [Treponema sp.]